MLFIAAFVFLFLLFWSVFYAAGPAIKPLLARSANWTAKFRYRDYLPVIVVLAAGVAATAVAGDAFLDIAERVHANSPALHDLDKQVHDWARTTRTPGATAFFTAMTLIGTPAGLGVILAAVTAVLVLRRRWRWTLYVVVTCGLGGLLNLELKSFFARARPELAEALRRAHGYSFPSGHAMGSTIVFGTLAYLGFRVLKHWSQRSAALAFACAMIVAIAASRVYLGVHWISDVGAGIAAGIIWVATATVAYEASRRIRLVRALRAKAAEQTASRDAAKENRPSP